MLPHGEDRSIQFNRIFQLPETAADEVRRFCLSQRVMVSCTQLRIAHLGAVRPMVEVMFSILGRF